MRFDIACDITPKQFVGGAGEWLCDATQLLLVLLALDRFADYEDDHAHVPVREAAAQALASCATKVPAQQQVKLLKVLLQMQAQSLWEVWYYMATARRTEPSFCLCCWLSKFARACQ